MILANNFWYFLIIFLLSIFSATYLLFAYYRNKLLLLNTLIFFLCAYRAAFEYYIQTIANFEELLFFNEWNGYGIPSNILIASQWICMWLYIRPLRRYQYERIFNYIFVVGLVILPFCAHSYMMAKGYIFEYHTDRMDGFWKFTMRTDHWYYTWYYSHTRCTLLVVIITLLTGVIQNKKNRFKQSLLFISYVVMPILYLSINVSTTWNIPNSSAIHLIHTVILSWYLSNYRMYRSNIDLISKDLFNSISDYTISTNEHLKITGYNDKSKWIFNFYGNHISEFIRKNSYDANIDSQAFVQSLVEEAKSHTSTGQEMQLVDKEGISRIMNIKASAFKNDDILYGYTFLLTDLTEIREKEQRLTELNNLKDTLFQIIGHDLKKPSIGFRNISKNINYLLQKEDYDRLQALGQDIDQDAKALYNLTDNLLNWALLQKDSVRISPTKVYPYDLVEENIHLLKSVATQKAITIQNRIPNELSIFIDFNSLDTVIRNLLDNALKYTQSKGTIVIKALVKHKMVQITIEDNGIGISDARIREITNQDIVKSEKGTEGEKGNGIGLQLVQQLLRKNKASLSIEKGLQYGSIFNIHIPKAS